MFATVNDVLLSVNKEHPKFLRLFVKILRKQSLMYMYACTGRVKSASNYLDSDQIVFFK